MEKKLCINGKVSNTWYHQFLPVWLYKTVPRYIQRVKIDCSKLIPMDCPRTVFIDKYAWTYNVVDTVQASSRQTIFLQIT